MTAHRDFLESLYDAAVAAAHPAPLVADAVDRLHHAHPAARRITVIALGKAAPAMAAAAVEKLGASRVSIAGGIVIGGDDGPSPHAAITRLCGDHPIPGPRSRRAAALLHAAARRAHETADVALVLISGGATSLVGAPVAGVTSDSLRGLYEALLRSGWDIAAMNAVRKRFLQWGAGRLAVALAPLPVELALLSDVIGDDPRIIASGPCTPDELSASDVARSLGDLATLDDDTRHALSDHLRRVAQGETAETPKPGGAAFRSVSSPLIHGNSTALAAAARHAHAAGWTVALSAEPLRGEARACGAGIAQALLAATARAPLCVIHGGETTVTIGRGPAGTGGRCQELALAAAQVLDDTSARASSIALLAAGTDGRDGPTDAAGAVVDADTFRRARDAGRDADAALLTHDSHTALAAAGALLGARSTGTNVMDIVVGMVGRSS